MIGGLDVPTKGEIFVDGRNITNLNKEQLAIFRRRKVEFVFQNYNLVPDLNVYENITLPVELDGKQTDRDYIMHILKLLKLLDKTEARRGHCQADSSSGQLSLKNNRLQTVHNTGG